MKQFVLDIIDYIRGEVVNDKCTPEQLQKIADFGKNELHVQGTIEEIADFYGQSRNNVSNVLSRRPIPRNKRPQRRVLYDFGWFATLVPKSWHKKRLSKE